MQMRPEPKGGVSSLAHYHPVAPRRLSPIYLKIATKRVLSLPDQVCVANVSSSFNNFFARLGARSISVDDETHLMHGMVSKPYRRGCRVSKQHYCGRKTLCLDQEGMVLSRSDNPSQNVPLSSPEHGTDADLGIAGREPTDLRALFPAIAALHIISSPCRSRLTHFSHCGRSIFRRCVVLRGDVFELSSLVPLSLSFTCHFLFAVLPLIIIRAGTAVPPAV